MAEMTTQSLESIPIFGGSLESPRWLVVVHRPRPKDLRKVIFSVCLHLGGGLGVQGSTGSGGLRVVGSRGGGGVG